jgi:hypothetical protein
MVFSICPTFSWLATSFTIQLVIKATFSRIRHHNIKEQLNKFINFEKIVRYIGGQTNMQKDQKNKLQKLLSILFVLFILVLFIIGGLRQCNLNNENSLGFTKIYDCGARGGRTAGFWIDYTLEADGKHYKGSSLYTSPELSIPLVQKYLLGKIFPAVYYPSNPSNSNILILPEDFEKYGYDFPDSLNWVKQLIEENKNQLSQ